MKIQREFSKHAALYGERNVIQREVAKKLVTSSKNHPRRILDLGCGSGTLFSYVDWEMDRFVGVDFSEQMLLLHPSDKTVELMLGDFNNPSLLNSLSTQKFDRIYSASALQWANNLSEIFQSLSRFNTPLSLALFTSGTFKTLHEAADLAPLLRSSEQVIEIAEQFVDASYEIAHYKLSFNSVREMFRYIKRSGVSGGEKRLTISEMKRLMEIYPLDYLEFEVLFILTD